MKTELNLSQNSAVQATEGPLLVLAGAGTGKTKVLTSRIIHILSCSLASSHEILAVTFTNKAAAEMKRRIADVIGEQVNNLWVGTFHAIAAKILRRHPEIVGLKSDFTIIDEDDQIRLIRQIANEFNVDIKQFPPKSYLNKISRLKDSLQISKIQEQSSENGEFLTLPKLAQIANAYQNRLSAMNATDFGDLLLHNLKIFAQSSETLGYYQQKFRYILVDEYQDTNNAQYQWLLRLSAFYGNICCVGDDDQSIYSWRGANIANILRFENDFANAKIIRLEQNYRSTSRILRAADAVIANNQQRHGKKLWTHKGEGQKLRLISFPDDRSESSKIAAEIQNLLASKSCLASQIAVLVRAGYQTRQFEESFVALNLPYRVIGGMKFYERMEIRDCMAYLRLCANFSDDLAFLRIINSPKRGIGEAALMTIINRSKESQIPLFFSVETLLNEGLIKGKAKESIENFSAILKKFHQQITTKPLSVIAKELLNETGYLAMWQNENTIEARGRLENIEEFINSLSEFASITEFLEYVSLIEARDDKSQTEAVNVMTIHAAKGLEFEVVYLPGLEEGIFPSNKSQENKEAIEEERRLLYVAITRAKQRLTISMAQSRYIFGDVQNSLPSRFIKELPEDEVEFVEVESGFGGYGGFNRQNRQFRGNDEGKLRNSGFAANHFGTNSTKSKSSTSSQDSKSIGKRVFHQKFGYGKIIGQDGNKLEIAFDKTGTKIIVKDFVTLA